MEESKIFQFLRRGKLLIQKLRGGVQEVSSVREGVYQVGDKVNRSPMIRTRMKVSAEQEFEKNINELNIKLYKL